METFVITAAVGVVVGILSGLLGIGGGTLMVPLFRLGFGLSALASTATSLFTIIPTSLVGFITHIKNKTCIPQLGIVCGLAGACTSPLGVHLANMSPAWMVMLAAAIIIGFSSFKICLLYTSGADGKRFRSGTPWQAHGALRHSPGRQGNAAVLGASAGKPRHRSGG